ncbi:tautomerase family protein [Pseudoxanthomonas sp. SL93]|uniref:tautomerase family protein n=1 Tax=Pseudoxanthomonas sp. SL93 TaxID=2995142 RepID=UPI0022709AFB|nr:tautomerase family protein [Pseudoxanthomonas sp. SL93]WAC64881.1 tautomerase family protein [Pseudoxanthomonas sp. SL93]
MPHVIVKLYPGRPDREKKAMADNIAQLLSDTMSYRLENISVAVHEVPPDRWMEDVYEPEMNQRQADLFRWPGYGSLAKHQD